MIDDELQQLEAELKRLSPVAPSAAVRARLALELAPRRRRAPILRFGWVVLPIAAGVVLAVALSPAKRPAASGTASAPALRFKPVAAQNILIDSQDEGTATLADGTVVRRTRESYLDTITWKNPRTNASLTWSVPREEVRVVPVSYE